MIIRTICAGSQFLVYQAAAFHGAAGGPDIPGTIVIPKLATLAGTVLKCRAGTAICAAAADEGNLISQGIIGI